MQIFAAIEFVLPNPQYCEAVQDYLLRKRNNSSSPKNNQLPSSPALDTIDLKDQMEVIQRTNPLENLFPLKTFQDVVQILFKHSTNASAFKNFNKNVVIHLYGPSSKMKEVDGKMVICDHGELKITSYFRTLQRLFSNDKQVVYVDLSKRRKSKTGNKPR